ncbi:hypothetical protein TcWFU_000294 [Taenia crassiceps]|uniref:C2H2-type domain-containing protein n=1 Tax=Taenia crassiceps TaxID=6207 RepID=A0ABR4Q683_9CEST
MDVSRPSAPPSQVATGCNALDALLRVVQYDGELSSTTARGQTSGAQFISSAMKGVRALTSAPIHLSCRLHRCDSLVHSASLRTHITTHDTHSRTHK